MVRDPTGLRCYDPDCEYAGIEHGHSTYLQPRPFMTPTEDETARHRYGQAWARLGEWLARKRVQP